MFDGTIKGVVCVIWQMSVCPNEVMTSRWQHSEPIWSDDTENKNDSRMSL